MSKKSGNKYKGAFGMFPDNFRLPIEVSWKLKGVKENISCTRTFWITQYQLEQIKNNNSNVFAQLTPESSHADVILQELILKEKGNKFCAYNVILLGKK